MRHYIRILSMWHHIIVSMWRYIRILSMWHHIIVSTWRYIRILSMWYHIIVSTWRYVRILSMWHYIIVSMWRCYTRILSMWRHLIVYVTSYSSLCDVTYKVKRSLSKETRELQGALDVPGGCDSLLLVLTGLDLPKLQERVAIPSPHHLQHPIQSCTKTRL